MTVDNPDNKQASPLNGYNDVQNGPLSQANRQCRDILCLILFLAAIGGMGYLTIYGYTNGNLDNIFRATDSTGNVCGGTGVAKNFPYAYFYNPTSSDLTSRYCVDACPTFSSSGSLTAINNPSGAITYAVTIDATGAYSANPASTSVIIGYDTTALLGRICIPSSKVFAGAFSAYVSLFSSGMGQQDVTNFMTDVKNNWKIILAAVGGCIVISFIFMYILRCLAGLIVWGSIFGSIIFFALGGFVFLYNAGVIGTPSVVSGYVTVPTVSGGTKTQYQIVGYVSFGLSGLLFVILLCCCSRIRLAVAICKCAGQFVAHTCSIILVPLFQAIVNIVVLLVCGICLLYILSTVTFKVTSGSVFTSINSYFDQSMYYVWAFLFGTLWCNALVQAVGVFVIASACCMWYYNHGPQSQVSFPIFRSYKYVFRYHLGSLAFGSLILAIVQFMQIIVQAVKNQAQATGANQNKVFEYVINCLRCCLACVERIVEFINKTAYIQMALRGKSFCSSAKDGFQLVWSNPARYAIVGGVGTIMMFLGKLLIASGTTAAFYCAITYISSLSSNIIQPIYLVAIVFLLSYLVGMLFMSIYSIAMDTILQCFIVDEANQKAKGQSTAKYAPEELQALIDPVSE